MQQHTPNLGAALRDATPINPVAMEREHRLTRFVQTVAVALSLLWSVGVVSAATYTFTSLAVPGPGVNTTPYSVNDSGHVVGTYQVGTVGHSFYFDGSAYRDVHVGDCVQVLSFGLNNAEEIVGTCQDAQGVYHGFFLAPNGVFSLYHDEVPGATAINLWALNVSGSMVGSTQEADGIHGLITDSTTWTRIDVPGGSQTMIFGINDSNLMSGWAIYFPEPQPAVYSFITADGVHFTRLQYPGAEAQTYAFGLSNSGQVVGTFHAADNISHGFLFDGSTYVQIDVPGAAETAIQGISPDGTKLVGTWNDGVTAYAFLATAQSDRTPPVITTSATPASLFPPNGRLVPVTVTGSILDSGSGVNVSTAAFAVMDEYRTVQPTGPVSLQPNGSYTFTVQLQASRRGQDQDGRHYTIAVSAKDLAGNPGVGTAVVVVPHG